MNQICTTKEQSSRLLKAGEAWYSFRQKSVRYNSRACEDILRKGGSNA